ncbi:MAG: serine/threonine-protein kinase [Polyangiaceae bacterium]
MECHAPADALEGTAYRAVCVVGRGGMGEVIEAEHRRLGKRVVVKLLHRHYSDRRDLEDRLRLEAQTLARLAHPNLVAVHDMGRTPAGRSYLVMERLQGCTLGAELRRRGALPWAEAVDITCQLLAGLEAAHDAGVVYRDVKLDNAFVCQALEGAGARRLVKLLDFGIAKVLSPGAAGLEPVAFPTDDEVAVGTPRFFSPEQALGNRVDARTDIYAAAVLLYSLLAGRGPFDHLADVAALVRAHATEKPSPPSRWAAASLPPELDRAVLRALAKQPAHRPPSAASFARELARIAAAHGCGVAPGEGPAMRAGPQEHGIAAVPRRRASSGAANLRRTGPRLAVAVCLVILGASIAATATRAGLARLDSNRERDFVERSRAALTMDGGPRNAP